MGLAQRSGLTDVPLLEQTIGDNLAETVAEHGDRLALVVRHQGVRWSYAEFAAEVDRVARGLLGAGIEVGDRVGIWSPNHVEWVLTQYATAKVGAILVCVNPAYRAHELSYVLRQSGCRMLVSATEHKGSDYRAMVDECRDDLPALECTIYIGTSDWDDLLADGADVTAEDLVERTAALSPTDPIN
ncbi:MAG: AMP-binding protein, partial [Acidimicrobiales bacterium]